MIISALTGGLGNQLFQYAAAFALARLRAVPLRLDIRHFNHAVPGFPARPYALGRLNISAGMIDRLDRYRLAVVSDLGRARPLKQFLCRLPLANYQVLVDPAEGYDPRLRAASGRTYLIGCWQSERYFADYRAALLDAFCFRDEPNEVNRAMLEQIGRQPSLCVHVRRGDYTLASTLTKPCSPEYYDRALGRMNDDVPGLKCFVFSDEPDWARANLRLPTDATFVTHNVGVADADDLRLMSACSHFIIANSTFSWWGAWLSKSPDKRVIAPAVWYPTPHGSENDLVPTAWTRL